MALVLRDVTFVGPAMPGPFVLYKLEPLLAKKKLLERESKAEAKETQERWEVYYRKLRAMREQGGEQRVLSHIVEPLVERLGYDALVKSDDVTTREGREPGGYLLQSATDGPHLRAWVVPTDTDLDAPNRRGRAYRFSPALIAQRVLLAKGERIGLLTDGLELRVVLSDPSGRDSHLAINLGRSGGWRASRHAPDSYRLLRAVCGPRGVEAIADLLDEARLAQSGVTKRLRDQARRAVEGFIQGLIDDPANREAREQWRDLDETAKQLWHEGLVFVYRLLFILKLETAADPARCFSFATVSTWRNSFSPSTALAPVVEKARAGGETGGFLAASLRALFRLFAEGLSSSDLRVSPLGGMLFGREATPLLDSLEWGEKAVADLLDALLWTIPENKGRSNGDTDSVGRERVHYGTLDVEDLGRVYEALLELEPGVTREPMCRLRRAKLEVVVPLKQGAPFRKNAASDDDDDSDDSDDEESGKKTKVAFVQEIPANRFFLRVGLGRKASGSYYTPHPFVRFLVQETLGPQVAERSPPSDPNPAAILALNVLDPAMGSGHFLVEACRFLGEALYEACRLCDEQALEATKKAETTKRPETRAELVERANVLWQRVVDLPDPNDELVAYLPSRILDSEESGLSQRKALALCRRLVAVHCLYGVDKNPLAVELARVSLWLESYAEGLPLTFLEHRLIVGDSLTGPFFEHLLTFPGTGQPVEQLHSRGVEKQLKKVLADALGHVKDLEASIGKDVADLDLKRVAKGKLDDALAPLKVLASVWSGGVMFGEDSDDMGYERLLGATANGQDGRTVVAGREGLARMEEIGRRGVPYDLVFPEVFHPDGSPTRSGGFDAVLGNPPWEKLRIEQRELAATIDPTFLEGRERAGVGKEAEAIAAVVDADPAASAACAAVTHSRRVATRVLRPTLARLLPGKTLDMYQLFAARCVDWAGPRGSMAVVLGGGFAMSPTEEPFRNALADCAGTEVLAHYLNIRQLFGGTSSRVSFVLWVARSGGALHEPLIGHALVEFGDIGIPGTPGGKLGPAKPALVPSKLVPSSRALEEMGLTVTEGLHRLHNKEYFSFTGADVQDARDPAAVIDLAKQGKLCLYGGKSIDAFDVLPLRKSGKWDPRVTLVVRADCPRVAAGRETYSHFRLAWRNTCGLTATNERSARACLLPPLVAALGSIMVETRPQSRPNASALVACAVINSFAFDAQVRAVVQTNFNKSILGKTQWPTLSLDAQRFLAHSALRLSAVHFAFRALWEEQLGAEWREPSGTAEWPVIPDHNERWRTRAAIDAVVASGYGLERDAFWDVLGKFRHKSYPGIAELCMSLFDQLKERDLTTFASHHDPYWDVPLVTTLPKPVIDLPTGDAPGEAFSLSAPAPKRGREKANKRA